MNDSPTDSTSDASWMRTLAVESKGPLIGGAAGAALGFLTIGLGMHSKPWRTVLTSTALGSILATAIKIGDLATLNNQLKAQLKIAEWEVERGRSTSWAEKTRNDSRNNSPTQPL